MKFFKSIVGALAAGVIFTGCVDKDPDEKFYPNPDVDFTYNVDGDEYKYDYYVVSTIQFNNTSVKTGNFTWDFGDGSAPSTEVSPTHKFEKAGLYKVTLTLDGVGSKTYPILIYDIVPVLSVESQTTDIVEFNSTMLTFNLELPNPENLRVKYQWTFPEGTTDADGNEITEFTGYSDENGNIEYPAPVKFRNIGSQRIDIKTWFDTEGENRRLEDSYLNVQVGTATPAPTIYYAQRGGNIKALKLVDQLPEGTKVLPYDMGVPSGSTVFNLCYTEVDATDEEGAAYKQGWVYILDAGKQYYYINDEDGVLGDGQITAMRTDGSGVNTVVTNVGGAAFNDPFIGYIKDGNLYYTDRNTGASVLPVTTRGAVEGKNSDNQRSSYFVQNNLISYYGRGIAYGAISNGLYKDKSGYWWWGKKYNGVGIFRFNDSQIYNTQKDAESNALPGPIVMADVKMSTFGIDEKRNALYCWRTSPNQGFLALPLPAISATVTANDATTFIAMEADPVNTTADEGLFTTQFAIDDASGRVYFCYRPAAGETDYPAGIYYFDAAGDKKMHKYGETNDLGTGIVINPNPSQLF